MIRVGFRLIGGAAWQGGRTYLWNLLHAITTLPAPRLAPVVLARPGEEPGDLIQPGVERFDTGESPRARMAGRIAALAIGRDPVEARWLREAKIDVFSHATPVGRVPAIGWIPDVQHRHLPQLSTRSERLIRDMLFRELLKRCRFVIASSEAARADLIKFYGAKPERLRVLRFVSQPRQAADIPVAQLRAKHGLPERWIHLPNQLWKHKNHALVVEALRAAPDVTVVATGPTENYRHPGLFDELTEQARRAGVADRFRHLGLVPFAELFALMHHAVAVVNPSRFEGWSTTVEEAKSLGKRLLVSDIAVHREQAAERATYFGIDDAAALASAMRDATSAFDPALDAAFALKAAQALPARTQAFGEAYEQLVL
ncbi:MAG: glycosyltransferase family 4 protein, partial [Deltaproteobacteria bacterium]|nr:glycosyltransferase family 4 protein [Deltaproteobacteria bacterium]